MGGYLGALRAADLWSRRLRVLWRARAILGHDGRRPRPLRWNYARHVDHHGRNAHPCPCDHQHFGHASRRRVRCDGGRFSQPCEAGDSSREQRDTGYRWRCRIVHDVLLGADEHGRLLVARGGVGHSPWDEQPAHADDPRHDARPVLLAAAAAARLRHERSRCRWPGSGWRRVGRDQQIRLRDRKCAVRDCAVTTSVVEKHGDNDADARVRARHDGRERLAVPRASRGALPREHQLPHGHSRGSQLRRRVCGDRHARRKHVLIWPPMDTSRDDRGA